MPPTGNPVTLATAPQRLRVAAPLCAVAALLTVSVAATPAGPVRPLAQVDADGFVTVDQFLPHTSTVPANVGERVGLFLREKMSQELAAHIEAGGRPEQGVVLFVHGGSVPSVPDYDLPYKDYSWMSYLAAAGFDTFAVDLTGYGLSPRPKMDDPCNLEQRERAFLIPNPLSHDCEPRYRSGLSTSRSDWEEIDRVVDHIRVTRRVDRVSLIGWSAGGPRTGGYAARHPRKVDKLVLLAPAYRRSSPTYAVGAIPRPDMPMRLQTKDTLMKARWESAVACEDQIDPGIQEAIWDTIMAHDPVGAGWGPEEGVMRVRKSGGSWGWNREVAARVAAPTLIMTGEQDGLLPDSSDLYADLGAATKVFVMMGCATHFPLWETTQYKFLHEASREWLAEGTFQGSLSGRFYVERRDGN